MKQATSLAESKPHYAILDGLRGVAAIMVLFFHILEVYSHGDHSKQIINHGYLAVDFFFLLSGFVIAYAYDDRWGKMTLKDFFKRRVIRLHPMIVIGSIIGGLLYYFQASPDMWPTISDTPLWKVVVVMLIGCTLIPVGKYFDIRGWAEMHPLNGAAWSLFFEYIANIVYAFVLRHLSKVVTLVLAVIAAAFTIHFAFTNPNGDIIGGWSISDPDLAQLKIGFIRLAFPFLAGIVLARMAKLKYTNNAFLWCSLLLIVLFSVPRLGNMETSAWMNPLYECICLIILFPFIVWLGAGGKVKGEKANKICKFLGDISYPLYITHFPIICVYMAWVVNNGYTLEESWPYGLMTALISVVVAYASMKLYDIPVREWLRKKFLK